MTNYNEDQVLSIKFRGELSNIFLLQQNVLRIGIIIVNTILIPLHRTREQDGTSDLALENCIWISYTLVERIFAGMSALNYYRVFVTIDLLSYSQVSCLAS